MKIDVTQADIDLSYQNQTTWFLKPEFTPIAVALRRLGISAWVGYDKCIVDNDWSAPILLPKEASDFQVAFGMSLYSTMEPHRLAVIKDLHKTNSDFKTEIKAPKKSDKVKPTTFEIVGL